MTHLDVTSGTNSEIFVTPALSPLESFKLDGGGDHCEYHARLFFVWSISGYYSMSIPPENRKPVFWCF